MESSETVLAGDAFLSSEQCPVEDSAGSLYPKHHDIDMNLKCCSRQDIRLMVGYTEDCYTATPGGASNGQYEYNGNATSNSHSANEGLEVSCQGIMLATKSEDNLHSNVDDSGTELHHYNKLTNNECILPIVSSRVQSDHVLKTPKEYNEVRNAFSLSLVNNSGNFDTVYSAVSPEQEDHSVLSTNYEELCPGDLLRGVSGSVPEVCLPLSVDCTEYDEGNKTQNKRKQRNKKRKRRSRGVDMQTDDRVAAQERRKMVAVVSVFAAAMFLTAVLLIVISLHMSQSSNPKGVPEITFCSDRVAGYLILLPQNNELYILELVCFKDAFCFP
ncbi:uncharacterized protein LOC110831775 isoform X7 [Zootermopsis nevadensis]|uniref:uncharacterized protein LOC110831775 isoform X7 n=1 Tax=Zootermopsis nevadensis TaxID=136037 RepID=UPI000B8E4634|nr:uncharacterized protein LOC110831775 isoform X7 [Zootermopsis nevadensis]